ncbi:Uncharacterised protein [Acinetobacter baumannii]|nr:Uncharacterised protein [Acinetobacter baumannii]
MGGGEQRQEGRRLVIVTHPGGADHIEIASIAAVDVGFPLLVLQLDVNPQLFLPHRGHGDGDLLVALRGVIQQRQLQRVVRAVTGRLQQCLGLRVQLRLRLLLQQTRLGFEPGGHIRREVIGRFFAGAQHFFRDNLAIDGVGQGLAHPHVVGRRTLGVERVIIGAELIRGVHLPRDVFQQLLIHIFREGFGDVDVTRQVTLGGVGFLVDRHEGHFGQHGAHMIPVMVVRRQHQLLVHHPLLQFERAVAHQIADLGPVVAVFFHHRLVHREQAEVGRQADEVRHRLVQLHLERVVIRRRYAQAIGRQFAADDLLGVLDPRQLREPGERRQIFRFYQPLPAVDEVFCRDRVTV